MWETAKMSYGHLGGLFMLRWNMMSLQKEYTIHLAVVSHALATLLGVSNIVKTESSLQMIYTSIVWFVFLTNMSDLLCFLQGGHGVLWLWRHEWMNNFKGCLERWPCRQVGCVAGSQRANNCLHYRQTVWTKQWLLPCWSVMTENSSSTVTTSLQA